MDGVSIAAGVIALLAAIILATVFNNLWPRVIAGLVVTGAAGIVNGTYGDLVRDLATKLDTAIGEWIGTFLSPGQVVGGLLGLAAIGLWIGRIWTNKIDTKTYALSAAVPVTLPLVPGTAGTVISTIVGIVPWVFAEAISLAFLG